VESGYLDNIPTQEELILDLSQELGLQQGHAAERRRLDLTTPFPRLSVGEAFRQHLGFDPGERRDRHSLAREAVRRGVGVTPEDDWADLFHKLYLTFVEPRLPRDRPVFITDYPAQVPTLARSTPDSPSAERWELYMAGVEIANCYTEETDAARVQAFFRAQEEARRRSRRPHPVDWPLARMIGGSLPPCSGVALGVDRLLAVLLGVPSLSRVAPLAAKPERPAASPRDPRPAPSPNRSASLNKGQNFDYDTPVTSEEGQL
jgi:lysyl-tRNA synthetase class 2